MLAPFSWFLIMEEDILSKFVKIMAERISDSDLEFVNLGKSLGLDLVSFKELRESQDEIFADRIRERALEKLNEDDANELPDNDMFYAGSIDFMVSDELDGKRFFLLETNGGSNRGLSILTKKQQAMKYDGYYEAINQAINRYNEKIVVLIGVPVNDGLIHEKVIVIDYLRKKIIERNGLSVGIYNLDTFTPEYNEDVAFLIADYKQLNNRLAFSKPWVLLNDSVKIHVLIGDGIARRIHDEGFSKLIKNDLNAIKTIIVNPIFRITDDKSLTYLASYFVKGQLEKYKMKYLLFTKAHDEEDLIKKIKKAIQRFKKPFIIKPNGGSGGAGVIPIGPDQDMSKLHELIEASKKEFYAKFMKNRDPYPYTIQEMADFSLIDWRGGKHTFDVRIYLAQKEGKIIPIGGLARIARNSYLGNLDKEEFVVNLSGFDGLIEVFRGKGISEVNAKLLDLTLEDFSNIFCIGCVVFISMLKNYEKIMHFKEWEDFIG